MKIGSDLYKSTHLHAIDSNTLYTDWSRRVVCVAAILPLVKSQVESQIKVRDFSNAKLTIQPSDATSWSDVRSELLAERKAALRGELESELAAMSEDDDLEGLRASFAKRERQIEHEIDSTVHTFSASFELKYNFLVSLFAQL